ncbi:hypothetical protein F5X97DRAFT_345789 [Nemania serpens]|nr:hypothetical protein F5X97DRAFT_345789 [Nemania serpens]
MAERDQTGARKYRSSIGVELEFLLCVAEADQPYNVPDMFETSKGAPYELPTGVPLRSEINHMVNQTLGETIAYAIASHRGTRVIQSEDEALSSSESFHLRPYSDWTVWSDLTVSLPHHQRAQRYMQEYRWYPVEIASPAFWATDESWEEIQAVVRAIRDDYWILTPPTAGLHYHYGNGKSYIPFGMLRRIAALTFAVDPIMVQLHPEHRRSNEWCLSNRLYSRVAHGRPAEVTARELCADYVEEEPEFPGMRRLPNPVSRPFRRRTPNLIVPFKRGTLTGYEFDDLFFNDSGFEDDIKKNTGRRGNPTPFEIPDAVREILRCWNAPTVAELMRYTSRDERPAYNFRAYEAGTYKQMIIEQGEIYPLYQSKRTIEFRQMASTMEPEEVVAHGKVIVRLCEFAAEADLEELWRVVLDCTVAEGNGDWFDVFDLLAELGLNSEANVLQRSVARFRGEPIPELIIDDGEEAQAAAKKTE